MPRSYLAYQISPSEQSDRAKLKDSRVKQSGRKGTLARRELVCRLGRSIISDSKRHLELQKLYFMCFSIFHAREVKFELKNGLFALIADPNVVEAAETINNEEITTEVVHVQPRKQ